MNGLTTDKMTNLYADLTSQISQSVKNISRKSAIDFTAPTPKKQVDQPIATTISFSGYAFSYLEPSSLYNLHRISTDLKNEDKVKEENRRQNQVMDKEQQAQAEHDDEAKQIGAVSFVEELQNSSKPDARFVSSIYRQNLLGRVSEAPLLLNGGNFTLNDTKYANNAYNYTFNLNNVPDTRIEYMHKYNRSFDYRI